MKLDKPSQVLAIFAWAFVFAEAGLLVLRKIPADFLSWGIFGLFFVVAVMASAVAQGKPAKPVIAAHDIRIRIGTDVFTGDALIVNNLRDGSLFVLVDSSSPRGKGDASLPPITVTRDPVQVEKTLKKK